MTLIKLEAFQIRNYRSIIDSGWRNLAADNITVLIGQNESGKTSVLEALQSFYSNELNEDVLRSDNSYPVVSCKFTIEDEITLSQILDASKLPDKLKDIVKNKKEFTLTRQWQDSKSNKLYISHDEIYKYYANKQDQDKKIEEQSKKEIDFLLKESESIFTELEIAEKEKKDSQVDLTQMRKELDLKQKRLRKAKKADIKLIAEKETDFALKQYEEKEKEFTHRVEHYENIKIKTQQLTEKITAGKSYQDSILKQNTIGKNLKESHRKLVDLEHLYELSTNDKDKRSILSRLQAQRNENEKLSGEFEEASKTAQFNMLVATKVFNGSLRLKQAENEAHQELIEKDKFYSTEKIGTELFNYVPVFEFFEDFSGLLPNKIDLEDILNENTSAEGFKAARNFLKIAGLDPSFFREKNHRILKQKIETLNSDVTINFQDYWSQSVGKDNKIRLQFELEHYDYTVPEKSGKPYLEFWIKDKQERLYPKQRSRGVRWFLSFYLELKATAVSKYSNRILLIDEPGLSLHARAQEDVLKVFEDLKESMQIVYCTHSPHLIKPEKLYRILAVQRADEIDDKSETLVFEPDTLSKLSADTLTPLYSLMGVRLSAQQFIQSNNIIVSDTVTYYYIHWLSKLVPDLPEMHFIPAAGMNSIPVLVNILAGWQLKYGVVLFGAMGAEIITELKEQTLLKKSLQSVKLFKKYKLIEDVFSSLDFKKYILLERVGITEKNSEYILVNNLSRNILAANFVNLVNESKVKYDNFDETTKENLKELFNDIIQLIQS